MLEHNKYFKLIEAARKTSENAKCHLSNFAVGAAILGKSERIYIGCNIEFDNYSNTIHAEEAALSAVVVAGERKIVAIAVFTRDDPPWFPCGMCRQTLFEYGGANLRVIACNNKNYLIKKMSELLPWGFRLGDKT